MVECMAACPPEFLSGPEGMFNRNEYLETYQSEQPPVRHSKTEPTPAVIDVSLLQACENLRRVKTDFPHPESKLRAGSLVDPPGLERPALLQGEASDRGMGASEATRAAQTAKADSSTSADCDLGGEPQYLVPSLAVPRDWAISERNTFLDVQPPQRQPLLRVKSEPVPDMEALMMGQLESSQPPPPMIPLEFYETDDPFETPQMLEAQACRENEPGDESAEMGLPLAPAPPRPPLQTFETDDPLDTEEVPMPPAPLSLQCFDTDDPMEQSIHTSAGDHQQLSAEWATFDPSSFGEAEMPPPPLPLENFGTEDPFETPQPLAEPATHTSESGASTTDAGPAFMGMYPMHAGMLPPPMSAPLMAAPLLPPPPAMAAPQLDEPCAPAAPLTAPSDALEDDNARPSHEAMRERGMLCCIPSANGCTHVHWAVDARKLESQDKQVVSPAFKLDLPGQGPQPFKLVLYPKVVNDGKHGAGFRKAKGKGRVVLKCEAQLPADCSDITLRISVGRDDKLQTPRGPVKNNFYEHSCQGLPKDKETWDFTTSVDEDSKTLLVSLELAPVPRVVTNPIMWWDENAK